ncbi:MAG: hypothetical protein AAFY39_13750, partial [Pseudomonadota bacterium]
PFLRTGRHHWVHTSNSDTWIQRKSPVPLDRCGAALALDLLPDRGTRMVVRSLGHGVRRFADSKAVIGIPKSVLPDRLCKIFQNGLAVTVP